MACHAHLHEQVAAFAAVRSGFAVSGHTDAFTVVNAGGDVCRNGLLARHVTRAEALRALVLNDLSAAAAGRAAALRLRHAEDRALGERNDALAAALLAGHRARSGLASAAAAVCAGFLVIDLNVLFDALHRFHERDADGRLDIRASPGSVGICTPAAAETAESAEGTAECAAEKVAEQIAEHVGVICAAVFKSTGTAAAVKGRHAVLVVFRSLIRIAQDGISLRSFLELRLSVLISGIHVRMVLLCEDTVGLLQFFLRGRLRNP